VRWETFHTTGSLTTYGVGADETRIDAVKPTEKTVASGCCG